MVTSCRAVTAIVLATSLAACDGKAERASQREAVSHHPDTGSGGGAPAPTLLRCSAETGRADTVLVYSDVETDSTTGDQSGVEISILRSVSPPRVTYREAAGELGASRVLARVKLGPGDSLRFEIPNRPDTARFVGRVSCDSLWGRWTPYPAITEDPKVFRRIRVGR